jgi:hypothetical protein
MIKVERFRAHDIVHPINICIIAQGKKDMNQKYCRNRKILGRQSDPPYGDIAE